MLKIKNLIILTLSVLFIAIFTVSCKKDRVAEEPPETFIDGPDLNFYALSIENKLVLLNAKTPNTIVSQVNITGLQTGESLLGIDFRPATGQLYGIGSASRLYVIDQKTGVARAVNTTPFTPALSGTAAGFDFNPTVDRIRLVTTTGQNLRLNPENGTVAATDLAINGIADAKVVSVAYTQNRAGAATTTLFDINITHDKLYKQDPPNDGKLVEVGALGYDFDELGGFDINPSGTTALAIASTGGTTGIYTIDLNTGKASKISQLTQQYIGIAIPTEPVAYGISDTNDLLIFNPTSTTITTIAKPITGLQTGETILGIDMRPLNGQLFGLGSTSRIYAINASSGVATMVGTGPLSTPITGTQFGFDFNPTVDRIRIVSNTGQNLRVNPADASLTVDLPIVSAIASISGAAYTNNFAGATTTVLYDIDALGDRLYKQDPPNNGTLVDVGPLGINVDSNNGFDIGSTSGIAYGIFTVSSVQRLYSINLSTGASTAINTITPPISGFTLGLGF